MIYCVLRNYLGSDGADKLETPGALLRACKAFLVKQLHKSTLCQVPRSRNYVGIIWYHATCFYCTIRREV